MKRWIFLATAVLVLARPADGQTDFPALGREIETLVWERFYDAPEGNASNLETNSRNDVDFQQARSSSQGDANGAGSNQIRRQTMRVMVFGKVTEDSGEGAAPTAEAFAAMDRFTEELVKAGVLAAGAGLKNNAQAKRVFFDGPGRTVIAPGRRYRLVAHRRAL